MPSPTVDIVREANRNLRLGLLRLQPHQNAADPIDPTALSGLLAELLRVAECLRSITSDGPAEKELEQPLSEYRSTLQALAQVLPSVHGRLLVEKTRLEIARSHVQAAASWTELSQKTL